MSINISGSSTKFSNSWWSADVLGIIFGKSNNKRAEPLLNQSQIYFRIVLFFHCSNGMPSQLVMQIAPSYSII